eukprot:m.75314 g.75314  ORF g.75314 m.75314 type:complete len:68 (-) comp12445_c0_seq1:270-473(-)
MSDTAGLVSPDGGYMEVDTDAMSKYRPTDIGQPLTTTERIKGIVTITTITLVLLIGILMAEGVFGGN